MLRQLPPAIVLLVLAISVGALPWSLGTRTNSLSPAATHSFSATNSTDLSPAESPPQCDDIHSCRTLYDIVQSCVLTIFACVWVGVHPNIPPPRSPATPTFPLLLKSQIRPPGVGALVVCPFVTVALWPLALAAGSGVNNKIPAPFTHPGSLHYVTPLAMTVFIRMLHSGRTLRGLGLHKIVCYSPALTASAASYRRGWRVLLLLAHSVAAPDQNASKGARCPSRWVSALALEVRLSA
ncbi:hypothetical protein FIBSPDRAFT_1018240 [Athelia psychrophila]|uniref:Uncharacterized protein n=1 Tax=Athelia psychrophila TaxID=1759441 RepID=A0A166KQJ1_9AGAM|nr:hypothetical protein FIBSPDRAFT_1018240 [Fibularhizoctonia sp. CBS 109695]